MTYVPELLVGTVLTLGGGVSLGVSYVAWAHREHPAATPLSKMALLPGIAGLCFAAAVVYPYPPVGRWLLAGANTLLFVTVAYFLLFTLVYTGHEKLITRKRRLALVGFFGVAGVAVILDTVTTATVTVETVQGLTLPVIEDRRQNPVYLALIVPTYVGIVAGIGLLARFLVAPGNVYRKQTAIVTAAVGLTVVGSIAFESGLSPHPGLNLAAVFYAGEVALIWFALFRYELLNVEPLAPEVVLNEVDDPVVVLDESENVIDANPAARRLFDAGTVGSSVEEYLPGLLDAAERDEEYHYTGPDSTATRTAVYDINRSPITDQYDRSRGTVIVLRDITVQKQREQTLESLQSVSQRFLGAETVEEVLNIAVDTAYELLEYPYSGAMLYDADADVLRPAAFAEPLSAAYENSDTDGDITVQPGDSDIWQTFESGEPMLGKAIEEGEGTTIPVDIGGSLLYPLGRHGILGISARAGHDGFNEEDRRFAAILASATENALDQVDQERQLRESNELLAARTEQIEFFNGVLRHNLLNGIHVVRAHTELLEDHVTESGQDNLETIDSWMADITSLAETVRSVTRTVTGEEAIELEAVDIGPVLRAAVEKTRNEHTDVSVDLAVDLDRFPAVRGNDLFGEVFWNLLSNAVAHNDTESPVITIEGGVTGETVSIRVSDNGPGIDDEMKESIFEEGVTSSDSGSVGFGLYFVQVMVSQYGGDIWFEDNDPRGAVAVVELPVDGKVSEPMETDGRFRNRTNANSTTD